MFISKGLSYVVYYYIEHINDKLNVDECIYEAISEWACYDRSFPGWFVDIIDDFIDKILTTEELGVLSKSFTEFHEAYYNSTHIQKDCEFDIGVTPEAYFEDAIMVIRSFIATVCVRNIKLTEGNIAESYLVENIFYWLLTDAEQIESLRLIGVTLPDMVKRHTSFSSFKIMGVIDHIVYRDVSSMLSMLKYEYKDIDIDSLIRICMSLILRKLKDYPEQFVVRDMFSGDYIKNFYNVMKYCRVNNKFN